MIDHDRLFKELIATFFLEFLELFFPQIIAYLEPDSLKFLDKEVFTDVTAGEQYEADLVVQIRFREQETFFLVHIENQSYPQADFGRRMFRYFARLFEKHALPVYPIVIFSYDTPRTPQPNIYRVEFPDKTVLEFNYGVVQLNQLNWRDFLQQENPVASALMAKMNIAPSERPRVKAECLRLLATLRLDPARMKMISGFVDTYLKLNAAEAEIFQTEIAKFEPVKQEVVMEIVTSWELQGIQKGKLELIMRQLNRKVGALTPELESEIRQLSTTQLEDLAEALLDFTNIGDLVAWLNAIEE
ncbi:flagellar assembly protein H [Hapalosiphon sp. MRB220]|nr:flagellar assembly protein H [Hapalosiphon sp. MRB220]